MTDLGQELTALLNQIEAQSAEGQLEFSQQLGHLLARMQAQGLPIPPEVQDLHCRLLEAAVEAQFDNLPV